MLQTWVRFVMLSALAGVAAGQQAGPAPMGSVPTRDALVTGGLEVRGDNARLLTNASVTAYDRTASIRLERGGEVLVCSTSQFHLLHSGTGSSLLFGLDRGAIELHTDSAEQDVILTPDIRFTLEHPGHYDLRLRVTQNGDTCVDNAGPTAPVLTLADAFSSASYRLIPGQHVLFEHGSLREVVDHERSPCGCPATVSYPTQMTMAAAGSQPAGQPVSPNQAAAQNPFPAAASQGLAPAAPIENTAPTGEQQTQVATMLSYDAAHPAAPAGPATVEATTPGPAPKHGRHKKAKAVRETPPPSPPGTDDLFHLIGRFFHRLFHSGE